MVADRALAADEFTAYGASHQAVLVLLAAGAIALVWPAADSAAPPPAC